jgi:hypothetical protein
MEYRYSYKEFLTKELKLGAQRRGWYGSSHYVDEYAISDNEITIRCGRIVANALLMKVGKDVNGIVLDCFKHLLEFRKVMRTLDHIACMWLECEVVCRALSQMRYPYINYFLSTVLFLLRIAWALLMFSRLLWL